MDGGVQVRFSPPALAAPFREGSARSNAFFFERSHWAPLPFGTPGTPPRKITDGVLCVKGSEVFLRNMKRLDMSVDCVPKRVRVREITHGLGAVAKVACGILR